MQKITICSLMRAKNKQSFFALHQIQTKLQLINPSVELDFHVIWDNDNELNMKHEKYWSDLLDNKIKNLTSYNKDFFKKYLKNAYELCYEDKFSKYTAIYVILLGHYLRRVKLIDYYLLYDDDIIINNDFKDVYDILVSKTPMVINEPMNINCDKVLMNKLIEVYGNQFYQKYMSKNPSQLGFNSGFQGLDLTIYDDFLSSDRFKLLLDVFTYESIYDENGDQFFGNKRFFLDTQVQSFLALMNISRSNKDIHILDPDKYYVVPNWGTHPVHGEIDPEGKDNGWTIGLKSNITHFIGHTHGKGKPTQYLELVDNYLKKNKFI